MRKWTHGVENVSCVTRAVNDGVHCLFVGGVGVSQRSDDSGFARGVNQVEATGNFRSERQNARRACS